MSIQMSFVNEITVSNFDSIQELKLCIENALDRWNFENWKIIANSDSFDAKKIGESIFVLCVKTLEDN